MKITAFLLTLFIVTGAKAQTPAKSEPSSTAQLLYSVSSLRQEKYTEFLTSLRRISFQAPEDALIAAEAIRWIITTHGKDWQTNLEALKTIESKIGSFPVTDQDEPRIREKRLALLEMQALTLEKAEKHQDAVTAIDTWLSDPIWAGNSKLLSLRNRLGLVGSPAPTIAPIKSFEKAPDLRQYRGKVVILDFFAHWCKPCIAGFPKLKSLIADNPNLALLGVTQLYGNFDNTDVSPSEELTKLKGFLDHHQVSWPTLVTFPQTAKNYGVNAIPHLFVIDKKGIVQGSFVGNSDDTFARLKQLVQRLNHE